jgi:hypothetical protein
MTMSGTQYGSIDPAFRATRNNGSIMSNMYRQSVRQWLIKNVSRSTDDGDREKESRKKP